MIISISGADGVGKSSIVKNLSEIKSKKVTVKWQRFNKLLSLPFNALMKLTGKNFKERYTWGTIGYHNYTGSIGAVYILLNFIDFKIFSFWHAIIWKKFHDHNTNNILILDRYLLDVMSDLIVSTDNSRLVISVFRNSVYEFIKKSMCFVVTCEHGTVIQRRPDILDDKVYRKKINAYKMIYRFFKIKKLDTTSCSQNEVVNIILNTSKI